MTTQTDAHAAPALTATNHRNQALSKLENAINELDRPMRIWVGELEGRALAVQDALGGDVPVMFEHREWTELLQKKAADMLDLAYRLEKSLRHISTASLDVSGDMRGAA